jgi:O-antigen/teichoic acid export membrane protein
MSLACIAEITKLKNSLWESVAGSRKGIEDVFVSMIPQCVSVAAGFVTLMLIARGLGPRGMGSYALITSVSGLAAGLSDLGIGQTAIRYASRAAENNDPRGQFAILRWAFRLRLLLVSFTSIIAFAAASYVASKIWHEAGLAPLVRFSLLTGIFSAVAAIPTIYFQSLKRFKMNAAVSVGQTLALFMGIAGLAVLNNWSLESVISVSIASAALGAIAFVIIVPKAAFYERHECRQSFRNLLHAPKLDTYAESAIDDTGPNRFAIYMLISSVTVTVAMRADVWLMGMFLEKSQIGLYSVVSRFTLPLTIILGALNTALWPRASATGSLVKSTELIRKTFRMSFLVAIVGLVYSVTAPLMTPELFGPTYKDGILLGQLLCVRYCIAILACPIGIIGYSFGLVSSYWLVNSLQLIVIVALNIVMLPRIGPIGAALSLIANDLIGSILISLMIFRKVAFLKSNSALPVTGQ